MGSAVSMGVSGTSWGVASWGVAPPLGGCKNRSVDAKAVDSRFRWTTRLRRSDCKVSSQPTFATFGPPLGPHRRRAVEIRFVCVSRSLWSEGLTPPVGKIRAPRRVRSGVWSVRLYPRGCRDHGSWGLYKGILPRHVRGLRPAGGRGGTYPPISQPEAKGWRSRVVLLSRA